MHATSNNTDTFAKEEYRRYLAYLKSTSEQLGEKKTEDELIDEEFNKKLMSWDD